MDNIYAKVSAQELVSLLSKNLPDHEVDKEIFRRLSMSDGRSEMWGQLVGMLVHRILYCINRGMYLDDLLSKCHDVQEVVNEACVELLEKEAWKEYDGRRGIINWLGGQNGVVRDAIKKVLNPRRKTQHESKESANEISIDFTRPVNELSDGTGVNAAGVGALSDLRSAGDDPAGEMVNNEQKRIVCRWGNDLWKEKPKQALAFVLSEICAVPAASASPYLLTTTGNVPQLKKKAFDYFAERARELSKKEEFSRKIREVYFSN